MKTQNVSNSTSASSAGTSEWKYTLVAGRIQASGTLTNVMHARDAMSQALGHTDPEGRSYMSVLGLTDAVLKDVPCDNTDKFTLELVVGVLQVRKAQVPTSVRLAKVVKRLQDDERLELNIDYAYTQKAGRVNILCATGDAAVIRRACAKHAIEIASVHTFD